MSEDFETSCQSTTDPIDIESLRQSVAFASAAIALSKKYSDSSVGGFLPIQPDKHCVIWGQVRFPRSKAKRIRKKWSRCTINYGYIPDPNVFAIAEVGIVGHPQTIDRMLNKLAKDFL